MERQRLRPAWSAKDLARIYSTHHDHHHWTDHRMRVPATSVVADWMTKEFRFRRVADLSCGDGAMLGFMKSEVEKINGDWVSNPNLPDLVVGPIEETILQVDADMLVCAETIEHLDDPDTFLGNCRTRFRGLVLSTPVGSWNDPTPGHYWAWSRSGVETMLDVADWKPVTYSEMEWSHPGLPHRFGIWGCLWKSEARRWERS